MPSTTQLLIIVPGLYTLKGRLMPIVSSLSSLSMPELEREESLMTPDFISQSLVFEPSTGLEVHSWEEYEELRIKVG
jgi:hypothetical protein